MLGVRTRMLAGGTCRLPYSRLSLSRFNTRLMASVAPQSPLLDEQMMPGNAYWRRVPRWADATAEDFINYNWQTKNSVQNTHQLIDLIASVVPHELPQTSATGQGLSSPEASSAPKTGDELVEDVKAGIRKAPMAVKLTPHILSLINWSNPLHDPLFRQFIPLGSRFRPDHPKLTFDSLDETGDSPVKGLIHRYPDRAAFLASSVCPVYCRFCTRSYAVGTDTNVRTKSRFLPIQKKWEPIFQYIESTPALNDVLVTGGDGYTLSPEQLSAIGNRLLDTPHILRIRIASKGVAICPSRLIDPDDAWANTVIELSRRGRKMGKNVAMHTHFNHPNEVSWVTQRAAQRMFEEGVTVRNQTVLLNGVNNDVDTMKKLIRRLSSVNVQPYYVFQSDMISGVEDLRTPLHEILNLERQIRGSIAGFMTPNFVVNLAGGGGKRLACSFDSYDRNTGLSTFISPGSKDPDRKWEHWDPLFSLPAATAEQRAA